jgi:hypothetical protein
VKPKGFALFALVKSQQKGIQVMVTQMKNAAKRSISEGTDSKEKEGNNSLTARTVTAVDAAIKSRTESFGDLMVAATLSVILMVVHGRPEQFNRLFSELKDHPRGRVDAEAIRQQFVPRLHDEYAAGGVRDPDNESAWIQRPVGFISFASDPEKAGRKKNEYFLLAKVTGTTDKDKIRAEHIANGRKALENAGEEGIMALEWMTADKVTRPETGYDIGAFRSALVRELKKAAKSLNDPDSGITTGMIEETMRFYGFDKKQKADVRSVMDVAPVSKPIVAPVAANTETETKAEAEKESAAAA